MNIYFFGPATKEEKYRRRYALIKNILNQAGASVSLKSGAVEKTTLDSEIINEVRESGGSLLDQMDGFVIEVSTPDPEIGYLLACAILQKKPTLCLHEKKVSAKYVLKYLAVPKVPEFLQIQSYSPENLDKKILKFLQSIEHPQSQEDVPSIKFTLRITPRIEKYLHWKTHNTKISKADFLRKLINDDLINKDKEYQKYLKKILS